MLKIKDLSIVTGYGATTCRGILKKIKEQYNRTHSELSVSINDVSDYFGLSIEFIKGKVKI